MTSRAIIACKTECLRSSVCECLASSPGRISSGAEGRKFFPHSALIEKKQPGDEASEC